MYYIWLNLRAISTTSYSKIRSNLGPKAVVNSTWLHNKLHVETY